jgi:hypothetical protein
MEMSPRPEGFYTTVEKIVTKEGLQHRIERLRCELYMRRQVRIDGMRDLVHVIANPAQLGEEGGLHPMERDGRRREAPFQRDRLAIRGELHPGAAGFALQT